MDDAAAEQVLEAYPSAVVVATVVDEMERIADAFMPAVDQVLPAAVSEQIRRNAAARAEFLQRYACLGAEAVAEAAQSRASNRRALASRWRSDGLVFAVEAGGRLLYPAFQLDDGGRPRPVVAEILAALARRGFEGWQVALWFDTPQAALDWETPAARIEDPGALRHAIELDSRPVDA